MGIGTKTKALRVARAEMHCSCKRCGELVPSGKMVGIVHVLLSGQQQKRIACPIIRQEAAKEEKAVAAKDRTFQWGFSETSGKTVPIIDLQCHLHTPWPWSPLCQAQLDGLSNIRPITWFYPVRPWTRRRITALQMGATQVWWHESVRPMSNVNCIARCATLRVCAPARCSFTGNPSQINMTDTPYVNSSPVAYIIADIGDFPSGHCMPFLGLCHVGLFCCTISSFLLTFLPEALAYIPMSTNHLLPYFLELSAALSLHGHVSTFLVWSPS